MLQKYWAAAGVAEKIDFQLRHVLPHKPDHICKGWLDD